MPFQAPSEMHAAPGCASAANCCNMCVPPLCLQAAKKNLLKVGAALYALMCFAALRSAVLCCACVPALWVARTPAALRFCALTAGTARHRQ